MRVGLNATAFNDRPSGARQRFVGIYGALIRQRPDCEFVIYEPADCAVADWFESVPNVIRRQTSIRSVGTAQRMLNGAAYWRSAFARDALDLFEDFVLPLTHHPSRPTLLTIHDIRSLYQAKGVIEQIVRKRAFHRAFSQADRIIAVSDAIAEEVKAFHPAARLSTVYNGVDPSPFATVDQSAVDDVRRCHDLPADYVLAVGHLEERKNLPVLIDAIALLRDRGMARPLVIVGNDGGMREAVRAQIETGQVSHLVTLVEHADDATVRALYAGCRLLAFPSRYEGFGIPILEAMAAGKPMALADTPVFREITLGQGAYFPIDGAGAAAATIERVWSDPAERTRQIRFGERRLRDFSFDHLAGQVAAIYEELASTK